MFKKYLFPTDPAGGGNNTPPKTKRKRITPEGETDLLTVATSVNDNWKLNPTITVAYITQPQFEVYVGQYKTWLTSTRQSGGAVSSLAATLGISDDSIDDAVKEVKVYIRKKFKKNDVANYGRYGIVKYGETYKFPVDHDERKLSIDLMIGAITADGFGAEEYGTAFWTGVKTSYASAYSATNTNSESRSKTKGSKDDAKAMVLKVLRSLRLIIEGNYPDTFEDVLRSWGWLKEKY